MNILLDNIITICFILGISPFIIDFYDKKFNTGNVMTDEDMIRRYVIRRIKKV